MKKKLFLMGMLVMILVFGITVIGCDDGSSDDKNNSGFGGDLIDTIDYGSVTVKNASGAALTSVSIRVNGKSAASDQSGISNRGSKTYKNIPTGTATVSATKKGNGVTSLTQFWNGSVVVTKGGTATITVGSTGWL